MPSSLSRPEQNHENKSTVKAPDFFYSTQALSPAILSNTSWARSSASSSIQNVNFDLSLGYEILFPAVNVSRDDLCLLLGFSSLESWGEDGVVEASKHESVLNFSNSWKQKITLVAHSL